jgi:hypothetical protein
MNGNCEAFPDVRSPLAFDDISLGGPDFDQPSHLIGSEWSNRASAREYARIHGDEVVVAVMLRPADGGSGDPYELAALHVAIFGVDPRQVQVLEHRDDIETHFPRYVSERFFKAFGRAGPAQPIDELLNLLDSAHELPAPLSGRIDGARSSAVQLQNPSRFHVIGSPS